MRLAYITVHFPFGPEETFIIPELMELVRRGHDLLIVTLRPGKGAVDKQAQELSSHAVRMGRWSETIRVAPRVAYRNFSSVRGSLQTVMSSGGAVPMLKNLAVFPEALAVSEVIREWGAEHIHAYWASTPATVAMVAAELTGIPWSFTAHRHDIAAKNLLSEKIRKAKFVRFIAQRGIEMAGVPNELESKTQTLHLGVDLPDGPRAIPSIPIPAVVLCPGSLIEVKGHKYLIDAFARVVQEGLAVQLWLAGEGALLPTLKAQVQQLGLEDKVRFLGRVAHEELLAMYADGRVAAVVLPSIDLGNGIHEGIPISLVEAMGYGVPVLATNTGGIPELLGDGSGVMVAPADSKMMAEGLRLLLTDENARKRLSLAGRSRVEQSFSVRHTVEKLLQHFEVSERGTCVHA
jgi:colanic acid/amylovoran biosynthesis glycosyltransferase